MVLGGCPGCFPSPGDPSRHCAYNAMYMHVVPVVHQPGADIHVADGLTLSTQVG